MYELGLYIDGARYRVWRGESPSYGMHDLMDTVIRTIRLAKPEVKISWYCERNGVAYSY